MVLVTVNYRVGPFGFLTLGTDDAPGNVGLLDQRAALAWVQGSIGVFGGDPGQVALAGESAGSYSATYHLLAPRSSGLFHRVIGQSGAGGLAPGFHHWSEETAVRLGTEIAILVGCLMPGTSNRLACLRDTSAQALSLVEFENGVISQPVDDAGFASDPFFPVSVEEAWKTGQYNTEVELLIGTNREEGLLVSQLFLLEPGLLVPIINIDWDIWGPLAILQKHYLEITPADSLLANTILETYTGVTADLVTMDHFDNVTNMLTDAYFQFGVHRLITSHLEHSTKPLYNYLNTHVNTIGQANWAGMALPGASHADELWLEFYPLIGQRRPIGAADAAVSLHMTRLWTNFVRFGSPSPPGEAVEWGPVEGVEGPFINMQERPSMQLRDEDYRTRMEWWSHWFP